MRYQLYVYEMIKKLTAQLEIFRLPWEGIVDLPKIRYNQKKYYECYHNVDNPCNPCPTLKYMKTGQVEREIVKSLSGSSIQWIELFSYPMWDNQNEKMIGAVEFVRDITSRIFAEEVLRESEKFFSGTLNNLLTFIGVLELNGKGHLCE